MEAVASTLANKPLALSSRDYRRMARVVDEISFGEPLGLTTAINDKVIIAGCTGLFSFKTVAYDDDGAINLMLISADLRMESTDTDFNIDTLRTVMDNY